jgi:hypothetical protein
VVVLSLLSKAIFTFPSAGVMINPLLVVEVSQLWTAAVASTYRNVLVFETLIPLTTGVPSTGLLVPFTANSVQGPLANEMLMLPDAPTLFTKRTRVALETFAAVVPEGRVERSNCASA